MNRAKPLIERVSIFRERPRGSMGWGLIHIELGWKGAPRRNRSVCGLVMSKEFVSKRDWTFDGWAEVLCDDCAEVLSRFA